jgi:hypothetical protein
VGVHLLGELPGDLHRLDAGAEGAAEDALDETFDPCFQVAQDADGGLLGSVSGRADAAQGRKS